MTLIYETYGYSNGGYNHTFHHSVTTLAPLDFLRGYVKSLDYVGRPQTINALKDNITHVIRDIERDICMKVFENLTSTLSSTQKNNGDYLADIILHK